MYLIFMLFLQLFYSHTMHIVQLDTKIISALSFVNAVPKSTSNIDFPYSSFRYLFQSFTLPRQSSFACCFSSRFLPFPTFPVRAIKHTNFLLRAWMFPINLPMKYKAYTIRMWS